MCSRYEEGILHPQFLSNKVLFEKRKVVEKVLKKKNPGSEFTWILGHRGVTPFYVSLVRSVIKTWISTRNLRQF